MRNDESLYPPGAGDRQPLTQGLNRNGPCTAVPGQMFPAWPSTPNELASDLRLALLLSCNMTRFSTAASASNVRSATMQCVPRPAHTSATELATTALAERAEAVATPWVAADLLWNQHDSSACATDMCRAVEGLFVAVREAAPLDARSRSTLRHAVDAYVDVSKARGCTPESTLAALKAVVMRVAPASEWYRTNTLLAYELVGHAAQWCIARLFGEDPNTSQVPAGGAANDQFRFIDKAVRRTRGRRRPQTKAENRALHTLAQCMDRAPAEVLAELLSLATELVGGGESSSTAGVSMLEATPDGGQQFRWVALAGRLASHVGGTTPRFDSPCGECLEHGEAIVLARPDIKYAYFLATGLEFTEGLIVPFVPSSIHQYLGTIWVVSHPPSRRRFDDEDVRLMISLATFACQAYRFAEIAARTSLHEREVTSR